MTAKDLKNALLQEAVQGKLVPQIASEGNARDLLEEIKKEKLSHGLDFANAKSGKRKSKKETALAGSNPCDITEDEIPFEIPKNWCWCRLGEIIDTNIGLTYSPTDIVQSGGIAVLRSNNIQNGEIVYNDLVYVSKTVPEKCMAKKGDLLICARNGSRALVGKCAIIKENGMSFGAFMALIRSPFNSYIMNFINSPLYRARLEGVNTTTINQITQDNLKETLIPLPPLAEQKRIVAAIEKFMPLIEEYGKKETQLKAINEKIGTLTKKAILQEAVQGKLVPQIDAEGNAKDLLEEIRKERLSHGFANSYGICSEKGKKSKSSDLRSKSQIRVTKKELPEITEDEIPFDIPESWCWCRLGEIVQLTSGQDLQPEMYNSSQKGIPYITGASNFNNDNVIINRWTETPKSVAIKDDLLLTCKGTVGEMAFLNEKKVHIARQVMSIRSSEKISLGYVKIYLTTQIENLKSKAKSMIPGIAREDVISSLIPLPPLAEQKRIVAAIEKMLTLCEKLGGN